MHVIFEYDRSDGVDSLSVQLFPSGKLSRKEVPSYGKRWRSLFSTFNGSTGQILPLAILIWVAFRTKTAT